MSDESLNPVPSQPRSDTAPVDTGPPTGSPPRVPPLSGRGPRRSSRGPALQKPQPASETTFTPEQRLLILDAWRRSGLPAGDFAPLVGLSRHTLYAWKKKFDDQGPAGLADKPKGAPAGSRLPEVCGCAGDDRSVRSWSSNWRARRERGGACGRSWRRSPGRRA